MCDACVRVFYFEVRGVSSTFASVFCIPWYILYTCILLSLAHRSVSHTSLMHSIKSPSHTLTPFNHSHPITKTQYTFSRPRTHHLLKKYIHGLIHLLTAFIKYIHSLIHSICSLSYSIYSLTHHSLTLSVTHSLHALAHPVSIT